VLEDIFVPETWSVEPLSKCVDVLDSRRKPVNSSERSSRLGSVPYYGATGQVGWIDDYLFDEELVLVGEDGAPYFDKSKPIAYIISGKSWVNNHAHVLRARQGVTTNRYIKYYLDAFDFTDYVQGSTRDKLTQVAMNSIPVVLPLPQQQEGLIRAIETFEEKRVDVSAHLTAARRALERLRQALLADACSGRLTADWRLANAEESSLEHALIGREAGRSKRRRTNEGPIDMAIPELPASYVLSSLGAAAETIEYGTSKRCDAEPESGVAVLRMGNIQDGRLDLSDLKYCVPDSEIDRLLLSDGDVLFNRTNSPELVGKSAVYHGSPPMSFASYLIRVRLAKDLAEPDYVNYWINSAWGREWASLAKTDGVSQSNINGTKLSMMPLPLPPIEEQREIVRRASRMLTVADELLARIDAGSGAIERARLSVLAKVFRGELATGQVG
jgi:type I restriction enzyme S subunit